MKGYFYLLLVSQLAACAPGTLSEQEQAGFHTELARLYGDGGYDPGAAPGGNGGTQTGSTSGNPSANPVPAPAQPSGLPPASPGPATGGSSGATPMQGAPSAGDPSPSASGAPSAEPPSAEPPPAEPPPAEPPPAEPPPAEPPPAEPPPAAGVIDPCVAEVFASSCAGTVCHHAGIVNLPPDLERDNLFDLLTTETNACAEASSPTFIDLADPPQSYLMQKIRGEQPSTCGGAMPPAGSTPLTDAQLQCLEGWFASL